ncbi:MAG: hypothetical protein ACLS69_01025 [Butyricicoccus sp.]
MDYDKYDNQENQEVRRSAAAADGSIEGCAGTMVCVIAVVGASFVISLAAIFTANDVFVLPGQRHAAVLCFREHKAR